MQWICEGLGVRSIWKSPAGATGLPDFRQRYE